jgi:hypothetical protein
MGALRFDLGDPFSLAGIIIGFLSFRRRERRYREIPTARERNRTPATTPPAIGATEVFFLAVKLRLVWVGVSAEFVVELGAEAVDPAKMVSVSNLQGGVTRNSWTTSSDVRIDEIIEVELPGFHINEHNVAAICQRVVAVEKIRSRNRNTGIDEVRRLGIVCKSYPIYVDEAPHRTRAHDCGDIKRCSCSYAEA